LAARMPEGFGCSRLENLVAGHCSVDMALKKEPWVSNRRLQRFRYDKKTMSVPIT